MNEQKPSVPDSWERVNIDEILDFLENGNTLQQGWSPRCEREASRDESSWGVLKTTTIQTGDFQPEHNKRLPESLEPRPQIEVKQGEILMTCAGPRSRCGVACLVKKTRKRLMMSGKMYRFRTNPKRVLLKYLELFLHTQEAQVAINKMKTGISDSGLNLTHDRFRTLLVSLAPFDEQHRIVAKIEELFSEIDKGVESLKTAKAQLQVYRQALLKHTFEGKLTAQWRADNPDKVVPAAQLLSQIQQAREERYQQQLADWKTAVEKWELGGKEGKKPSKPKKIKPFLFPSNEPLQGFNDLPSQWNYIELGNVIDEPKYGTSKKCSYESTEFGVLRIPNIGNNKIDDSDLKFADFERWEVQDYKLRTGDILIIRSNGSISLVGKCAQISDKETDYLYAGYLIRLRPIHKSICPKYLTHLFSAYVLRKQIESKAKSTSGVNNINSGEIQSLIIPVLSIQEQTEIARLLDEKISYIEASGEEVESALDRAEALRQSILKKAFSGQLVPQDPTDEPASQLLARIQAEKASRAAKAKTKAKPSKKIR